MTNRTQRTKRDIHLIFWQELKEKPIEKITVKEICEKAMINRTTFYLYYSSIYDLFEEIQNNILNTIDELSITILSGQMDKYEVMEYILRSIDNNREYLKILLIRDIDNRLWEAIIAKLELLFKQSINTKYLKGIDEKQLNDTIQFLTYGYYGIYRNYIMNGNKGEIPYIARYLIKATDACFEGLM